MGSDSGIKTGRLGRAIISLTSLTLKRGGLWSRRAWRVDGQRWALSEDAGVAAMAMVLG